ncbi:hypothetical protein Aduo_008610 [Ancylostoma duodenale]
MDWSPTAAAATLAPSTTGTSEASVAVAVAETGYSSRNTATKELRYGASRGMDSSSSLHADRAVVWSRINIAANHMQFLTNEFDEDYQFSGVFKYKGRIIMYGHNVSNVL